MKKVIKKIGKKFLPIKVKSYIRQKLDKPIVNDSNENELIISKSTVDSYLKLKDADLKCLLSCLKQTYSNLPELLNKILFSDKTLIIMPLNYDLKLGQRPDEILKVLAGSNKFNCLFLSYETIDGEIEKLDDNFYITSLFWQVLSVVKNRKFIFLFTHPRYINFRLYFPNSKFIFDCLDEPSVLADSDALSYKQDFLSAISGSDINLYSSKVLFETYSDKSKMPLLITNGINSLRYQSSATNSKIGYKVFGYVGVISELIDFKFLNDILIHDEDATLYLVGPVKSFDMKFDSQLNSDFNSLKDNSRVIYVPFSPKDEIVNHIAKFNYGIIPFVLSDKTHGVLPLKLFEYMMLGCPIISTETQELLNFGSYIKFYDGSIDSIKQFVCNANDKYDYNDVIKNYSWSNLVLPLVDKLNNIFITNSSELTIDILNFQFFNFEGDYLYKGGAERYVYDLAKVIEGMGFRARIIQQSTYYFYQFVNKDIPVIGLPTYSGSFNNVERFKRYYSLYFPFGNMAICSPFELSINLKKYLSTDFPVLGINHGIYWDGENTKASNIDNYFFNKVVNAVNQANNTVCVDTNFINWLRTIEYSASHNTTYIPNYFNSKDFYPRDKDFFSEKVRICYPRRIYPARGSNLLFEAIRIICKKYPNAIFDIVGQFNSDLEQKEYERLKNKFKDQLTHKEYSMSEMHNAYVDSQIVLVPTCYSEGTSLSCIEAMATNNAIISTNVGGLPNLIIDGYNGLLINPDSNELVKSIEYLIQNRGKLSELAKNALDVSTVFELHNWAGHWQELIKKYLKG